jgi:aminopeptidase N
MHTWFQMLMATNESLYAWMDEGFTSYASNEVMNFLRREKLIPGNVAENPHAGANATHIAFTQGAQAEPLSVHADHFQTNSAYGVAAYVKGEVFLHQLKYIIGEQAFNQGMLRYYHEWSFRHPNPNDFIRVMEKTSGLELDWYKEYMVNTTHLSDYAITAVQEGAKGKTTEVQLSRKGLMPMPVDVVVALKNGSKLHYTIPLDLLRGAKQTDGDIQWLTAPDWPWTNPAYTLTLPIPPDQIATVEIDPSLRLVDANRDDNRKTP